MRPASTAIDTTIMQLMAAMLRLKKLRLRNLMIG
jgi:hypothetical protein